MPTLLLHAITAGLLATSAPPDACTLLTQAEAESILGEPIEPVAVAAKALPRFE
jgi:hypothetical protein